MSLDKITSLISIKAREFISTKDGNVAVIFALSFIPLLAFAGVAIDYGRANATKGAMQGALDATAVSLAKEAAGVTNTQLQADAQKNFFARFDPEKAKYGLHNIAVTAEYANNKNRSLVVTALASVPTTFLRVVGYDQITVNSSSTVKWSTSQLRVALVLANDASMVQSGKMTELKKAAKKLLTEFKDAASGSDDILVSTIPYAKDVNVGTPNPSADWLDWHEWDANNGTCTGGAHDGGNSEYGSSRTSRDNTEESCGGIWKPENHNVWKGCVEDRGDATGPDANDDDTNADTPDTGDSGTLYDAEQEAACPQEATGLSDDWNALDTEIDKMSAAGETNEPLGLQMGWMSFDGEGPFTAPAEQSGYTYKRAVVLVADHANSDDRWHMSESEIDARESMICNNIKAAGDNIYTIQISTDGTPASPTLQECASDANKFFYLTSADKIGSAFDKVESDLEEFYIAK